VRIFYLPNVSYSLKRQFSRAFPIFYVFN